MGGLEVWGRLCKGLLMGPREWSRWFTDVVILPARGSSEYFFPRGTVSFSCLMHFLLKHIPGANPGGHHGLTRARSLVRPSVITASRSSRPKAAGHYEGRQLADFIKHTTPKPTIPTSLNDDHFLPAGLQPTSTGFPR